jgi:outer membrane autotransporter protein
VQVEAEVVSFTAVARTENQRRIARHLDRLLPSASGDINLMLGEVQTLSSDAQFATAFFSLSPAAYGQISVATVAGVQQYTHTLQDRMTSLHTGQLPLSARIDRPIRLAYNGALLPALEDQEETSYGLWLKAFSQHGDHDAEGGDSGYEYALGGLALGFDKRLTDSFIAGVSFGQAKNDLETEGNLSNADIDSTLGSLYGSYLENRLYVTGVLSYGGNQYDVNRSIAIGGTPTPVTSSHDGSLFAGTLGAGRYFQNGPWWLDPFLYLQYTRLDEDGFSEQGGGGAGLTVEGRTTTALVSTLGLRISRIIESKKGGLWLPEASLAWLHDYAIDDQVINASYVGAPGASFATAGQPIEQNGALVGVGVGYRSKHQLLTLLRYGGEFRGGFTSHSFIGELRFEF